MLELAGLSTRRAQARTRALAYEVDPAGAVKRAGNARKDRRVGMRPAPDTMAMLSALLPCEQGVAAWAALRRNTDAQIAAGDERTRNQIIARRATTDDVGIGDPDRVAGDALDCDLGADIPTSNR